MAVAVMVRGLSEEVTALDRGRPESAGARAQAEEQRHESLAGERLGL